MPRSLGRIRFATGYGKWGVTNGPAAAQRIVAEILGHDDKPEWMTALGTRMTMPSDLGRGVTENVKIGRAAVQGWAGEERRPVPVPRPAEGEGVVRSEEDTSERQELLRISYGGV